MEGPTDPVAQWRLILDKVEKTLEKIDDDIARRNAVLPPPRPEKAPPPPAEVRTP